MKIVIYLTTLFLGAVVLLTSCTKEAVSKAVPTTTFACSEPVFSSSKTKDLLTAHTWQIDEVIDPFEGTRYKRGTISDTKDFASARYTYNNDHSLTGIDWQGQSLEKNYYTLEGNEQQLKFITPACCSLAEIIEINDRVLTYKSVDGSIFKLVPVSQSTSSTGKN